MEVIIIGGSIGFFIGYLVFELIPQIISDIEWWKAYKSYDDRQDKAESEDKE